MISLHINTYKYDNDLMHLHAFEKKKKLAIYTHFYNGIRMGEKGERSQERGRGWLSNTVRKESFNLI